MKKVLIAIPIVLAFFVWNGVGKIFVGNWFEQGSQTSPLTDGSSTTDTALSYQPAQCGYSVVFPERANKRQTKSPKTEFFEQVELIKEEHFIRASCMVFEGPATFDDASPEALVSRTEKFARQESLVDPVVNYSESGLGKVVVLSGTKRVQNMNFKFKYHFYYRGSARFTVVGGGLSSGYPQKGIMETYRSVRILESNGR